MIQVLASTPSRRTGAVSRGSAMPSLQAATYEGIVRAIVRDRRLAGTLTVTRVEDRRSRLSGQAGLPVLHLNHAPIAAPTLSGDLFDLASNACGTPGKVRLRKTNGVRP